MYRAEQASLQNRILLWWRMLSFALLGVLAKVLKPGRLIIQGAVPKGCSEPSKKTGRSRLLKWRRPCSPTANFRLVTASAVDHVYAKLNRLKAGCDHSSLCCSADIMTITPPAATST